MFDPSAPIDEVSSFNPSAPLDGVDSKPEGFLGQDPFESIVMNDKNLLPEQKELRIQAYRDGKKKSEDGNLNNPEGGRVADPFMTHATNAFESIATPATAVGNAIGEEDFYKNKAETFGRNPDSINALAYLNANEKLKNTDLKDPSYKTVKNVYETALSTLGKLSPQDRKKALDDATPIFYKTGMEGEAETARDAGKYAGNKASGFVEKAAAVAGDLVGSAPLAVIPVGGEVEGAGLLVNAAKTAAVMGGQQAAIEAVNAPFASTAGTEDGHSAAVSIGFATVGGAALSGLSSVLSRYLTAEGKAAALANVKKTADDLVASGLNKTEALNSAVASELKSSPSPSPAPAPTPITQAIPEAQIASPNLISKVVNGVEQNTSKLSESSAPILNGGVANAGTAAKVVEVGPFPNKEPVLNSSIPNKEIPQVDPTTQQTQQIPQAAPTPTPTPQAPAQVPTAPVVSNVAKLAINADTDSAVRDLAKFSNEADHSEILQNLPEDKQVVFKDALADQSGFVAPDVKEPTLAVVEKVQPTDSLPDEEPVATAEALKAKSMLSTLTSSSRYKVLVKQESAKTISPSAAEELTSFRTRKAAYEKASLETGQPKLEIPKSEQKLSGKIDPLATPATTKTQIDVVSEAPATPAGVADLKAQSAAREQLVKTGLLDRPEDAARLDRAVVDFNSPVQSTLARFKTEYASTIYSDMQRLVSSGRITREQMEKRLDDLEIRARPSDASSITMLRESDPQVGNPRYTPTSPTLRYGAADQSLSNTVKSISDILKDSPSAVKRVLVKTREYLLGQSGQNPVFEAKMRMQDELSAKSVRANQLMREIGEEARKINSKFLNYKDVPQAIRDMHMEIERGINPITKEKYTHTIKTPEGFKVIQDLDGLKNDLRNNGYDEAHMKMVSKFMEIRAIIDSSTESLINGDLIRDEGMKLKMIENLGSYTNSSYKIYSDKNWDATIRSPANWKRVLASGSKLGMSDIETTNAANSILTEIRSISEGGQKRTAANIVDSLSSKNAAFKDKSNVSELASVVMGEEYDPVVIGYRSINLQNKAIAQVKMDSDLYTVAKELGHLFDTPTGAVTSAFGSGVSLPTAGVFKSKLDGKFVTKEFSDIYKDVMDVSNPARELMEKSIVARLAYKGSAYVNANVTIFSPTTMAVNAITSPINLVFQGHGDALLPKNWSKITNSFKETWGTVGGGGSALTNAQRADVEFFTKAGILEHSVSAGDLALALHTVSNSSPEQIATLISGDKNAVRRMLTDFNKENVGQVASLSARSIQTAYRMGDDFIKLVMAKVEKSKYDDMVKLGLPQSVADDLFSKSCARTQFNYARVGKIVAAARHVPVVGPFMSFNVEACRVVVGTIEQGFEEINAGLKLKSEGNAAGSDLWKRGATRIASAAAVSGAFLGVTGLIGKQDDSIRNVLPDWDKKASLSGEKYNPATKKIEYKNADRLFLFGGVVGILPQALRDIKSGKSPADTTLSAFFSVYNLDKPSIVFGKAVEAFTGQTASGQKIYEQMDGSTGKHVDSNFVNGIKYLVENLVVPPAVKQAEQAFYGLTGVGRDSIAIDKKTGLPNERSKLPMNLVGFKEVDPVSGLSSLAIKTYSDLNSDMGAQNAALRDHSQQLDLNQVFDENNLKRYAAQRVLHETAVGLMKLGVPSSDIIKALSKDEQGRGARLSHNEITSIIGGAFTPWEPKNEALASWREALSRTNPPKWDPNKALESFQKYKAMPLER